MSNAPCLTWLPQDPNVPHAERVRCQVKGPHAPWEHSAGLHARYRVEKTHDPDGKHADCRYFVLDPQHDPLARTALVAYADAARKQDYKHLAGDLRAWLDKIVADR